MPRTEAAKLAHLVLQYEKAPPGEEKDLWLEAITSFQFVRTWTNCSDGGRESFAIFYDGSALHADGKTGALNSFEYLADFLIPDKGDEWLRDGEESSPPPDTPFLRGVRKDMAPASIAVRTIYKAAAENEIPFDIARTKAMAVIVEAIQEAKEKKGKSHGN